jgi:DNA-directed RNA polymerase specialized sigma24 family protein
VKALFAYGIQIVKDRAVVEDCIHDLFIELWNRKAFLSSTDSIKLYVFKSLKKKSSKSLKGKPLLRKRGIKRRIQL